MAAIPTAFLESMHNLLGEEFAPFHDSLHAIPTSGLRVNTLKITPSRLYERLPYHLSPLPWTHSGFEILDEPLEDVPSPGNHPYHASGLYYLQEPSAIAVAELVKPKPGESILDLCAAPGGKSTHLAALMQNQGLLVANETHTQRAWELAANLERWGVTSTVITNETPKRLADHLGGVFDRVLVDAPCSGEGMFRKDHTARSEWTPELVRSCALRQKKILEQAARLVKPAGWLVYSTCTFNSIENETVIAGFLHQDKEFTLVKINPSFGFDSGHPEWVSEGTHLPELNHTVRIWPHHSRGEGHFIALLQRKGVDIDHEQRYSTNPKSAKLPGSDFLQQKLSHRNLTGQDLKLIQNFDQENLVNDPLNLIDHSHHLLVAGSYVYRVPNRLPGLHGLRVIHPGWWLGTLKQSQGSGKTRFEPAHSLALALQVDQVKRSLNLPVSSREITSYLHGSELDYPGSEGWTLVAVDDFPLGWGKASAGRLKNAYPRGLRRL